MNTYSDSSLPESYWQGVRRRTRSGLIIAAVYGICGIACYAAYVVSHSIPATLAIGLICGMVSERADMRFDPIRGPLAVPVSDKWIWVALSVPAAIVLAGVLIYSVVKPFQEAELVGATGAALLLGHVLAATLRILTMDNAD